VSLSDASEQPVRAAAGARVAVMVTEAVWVCMWSPTGFDGSDAVLTPATSRSFHP
jgi:hypothetical protein